MAWSKLFVAAALIAAASSAAQAQVQRIHNGNALDANPQVGSGGANRPVAGFTPVNGNDVMTGNVAGLKAFKGNIPYSSPYEFRGNLGSASLDNFNRASAPQAGAYGVQNGLNQIYYSPQRLTAGAQGLIAPAPIGSGVDNRFVPLSSLSPTLNRPLTQNESLANSVPARVFDRLAPAPGSDLPGSPGRVLTSPLFGLRTVGEDNIITGEVKPRTPDEDQPKVRTDLGAQENVQGNLQERVQGRVNNQVPESETGLAALVGQTNKDEFKVSDTYRNLLASLQTAEGTPASPDNKTGGSNTTETPKLGTARLPALELDPVTGQAREVKPKNTVIQNDPTKPGYQAGALSGQVRDLTELPAEKLQAGQKVQPLTTLAGAEPTSFNEVMKEAESQLKSQKYLDAAATYQTALRLEPDNALALVGRAHACLAAGMYQSAVADLQVLFKNKPEMIAVRYKFETFMPAQREQFLLKDLAAISQKPGGNSASFLIAYIHYQEGRMAAVKAELDRQANREWRDGWEQVLAKAWLKN